MRPNWFIRIGLVIGAVCFTCLGAISTLKALNYI